MKRDYRNTIVPIFRGSESTGVEKFLGTGCFVVHGEKRALVTADHVISEAGDDLLIEIPPVPYAPSGGGHWNIEVFAAKILDRKPEVDLALLEVKNYFPREPLTLAKVDEINCFQQICTLEYSTTVVKDGRYVLSPAVRVGNVTRNFRKADVLKVPPMAREDLIEVSFPALTGASGSPIMPVNKMALWGILLANVDYQLLPVKFYKAEYDSKEVEETYYMAPMGIAVHVRHIRDML